MAGSTARIAARRCRDPEALRRLRAALPGAVPAAAARLLLYGHAFGCLPEAVALAALASQPDLFLLPRPGFFSSLLLPFFSSRH